MSSYNIVYNNLRGPPNLNPVTSRGFDTEEKAIKLCPVYHGAWDGTAPAGARGQDDAIDDRKRIAALLRAMWELAKEV